MRPATLITNSMEGEAAGGGSADAASAYDALRTKYEGMLLRFKDTVSKYKELQSAHTASSSRVVELEQAAAQHDADMQQLAAKAATAEEKFSRTFDKLKEVSEKGKAAAARAIEAESRAQELTAQVETLKQQHQAELEAARQSVLSASTDSADALNEQIASLRAEADAHAAARAAAEASLTDVESSVEQKDRLLDKFKQAVKDKNAQIAEFTAQLAESKERVAALEAAASAAPYDDKEDSATARASALAEECSELKSRLIELQQVQQASQVRISELDATVSEQSQQLAAAASSSEASLAQPASSEPSTSEQQQQQQQQQQEAELSSLRLQVESLQRQLNDSEIALQEARTTATSASESSSSRLAELEVALSDVRAAAAKAAADAEMAARQQKTSAIEAHEAELRQRDERVAELSASLSEAQAQASALQSELADTRSQLQEA